MIHGKGPARPPRASDPSILAGHRAQTVSRGPRHCEFRRRGRVLRVLPPDRRDQRQPADGPDRQRLRASLWDGGLRRLHQPALLRGVECLRDGFRRARSSTSASVAAASTTGSVAHSARQMTPPGSQRRTPGSPRAPPPDARPSATSPAARWGHSWPSAMREPAVKRARPRTARDPAPARLRWTASRRSSATGPSASTLPRAPTQESAPPPLLRRWFRASPRAGSRATGNDWSCVGHEPSAIGTNGDTTVTFGVAEDYVTSKPLADATVKVCRYEDPSCQNPLAQGESDDAGMDMIYVPQQPSFGG